MKILEVQLEDKWIRPGAVVMKGGKYINLNRVQDIRIVEEKSKRERAADKLKILCCGDWTPLEVADEIIKIMESK
jgi:hypothetical protein